MKPVILWEWINSLLENVGKSPIRKRISTANAVRVGTFLEWVWRTFSLSGEPMMTRFVAKQLASEHYYDLSAAIQDFGYREHTSPEEGMKATIDYFSKA